MRYGAIGFAQGTQNIKVALLFVKNRTGVPAFLLGAYLRKRQGRQAPPRCAVLFMPCAPRSWPSVVDRAWDARLRPIHREQSHLSLHSHRESCLGGLSPSPERK